MYMGRDSGDMTIWTLGCGMPGSSPPLAASSSSPAPVPASPAVMVAQSKVPQRLPAAPHPVVAMARREGLAGIRKAVLPRVLRILQAIADEAGRRGYQLAVETGRGSPRLCVRASGFRYSLTFREERERPAGAQPAGRPGVWQRRPDPVPTGRIQLSLNDDGRWWSDRKRWRLEDKLGEVFLKLERLTARDAARRSEEERKEEERRQQWEQAMALARDSFAEAWRRDHFLAQLDAWQRAAGIRQFCSMLEMTADGCDDPGQRYAVRRWIAWATAYADAVDPVRTPANLTGPDFEPEPDPEDLRPYLDGWSPHGPDLGYRWLRCSP